MNSETFDALTKSVSTTVGTRTDLGSRQPGFTENRVTLDPSHLTWGGCNSTHLAGCENQTCSRSNMLWWEASIEKTPTKQWAMMRVV